MIGPHTTIGKNTIIFHPEQVNIYGCTIGSNCRIGSFVEIKPEVTIGNNVKIQAFAFIPEGVIIEDNAFIGPHVCFINDRYPKSTADNGDLKQRENWIVEKTIVKKGASIGANATIMCGITIGENATVGAGSVVTTDVAANTTVAGNPAKKI